MKFRLEAAILATTLAAALAAGCCMPDSPDRSNVATTPFASISRTDSTLKVELVAPGTVQIFFDTDNDKHTGYGQGWEYEACAEDGAADALVIHSTKGRNGEWGARTGIAPTWSEGKITYATVPLAALGNPSGVIRWRVYFYIGNRCPYIDGSTAPPVVAWRP